jgi:hypothetical protein
MMKAKSKGLKLTVICLGAITFLCARYVALSGQHKMFFQSQTRSEKYFSDLSSKNLIEQNIVESFQAAKEKFNSDEENTLALINKNQSFVGDKKGLLLKIEDVYSALKPQADEVSRQLEEINKSLTEQSFRIHIEDGPERSGDLVVPLVEGLLAEYGPTEHHKGVLVSAERDEFGYLPVTEGISYREANLIEKQFENLKKSQKYTKSVELAHASFLRNWSKYGCNWSLSSTCQHPDPQHLVETDHWFKRVKREVISLRERKKILEDLQKLSANLESAHKKLSEQLVGLVDLDS